jgi:hypothetical protein
LIKDVRGEDTGKTPKFAFEMLAAGILWGEEKVQYIVRDTCTNSRCGYDRTID